MTGPAGTEQRSTSMTALVVAIVSMTVQQSFSYMATLVLPVVAPDAAAELGVSPALIGVYTICLYALALVSALSCGAFIRRYGPLRISQVAMLALALGLIVAAPGELLLFPLSAILIGIGSSTATPASSEILARHAPPRYAPLVFSIKQTGVPLGGVLAGILVPFCATQFGWRAAFVVTAAMCFVLALLLQPLRHDYDRNRQAGASLAPAQIWLTLRKVLTTTELRELAYACVAYVGVQAIFGAFFVAYLVDVMEYDLVLAGQIFAGAQAVSIGARILWGWLSSRAISPRLMLGFIGIGAALSCVATGLYGPGWSLTWVVLVAIAYSATAISFHGVLIAEIARLSPPGEIGPTTGAVLSFASAGMLIYPAAFGLFLALSDGYVLGFSLAALPALLVGLLLVRRRPARSHAPFTGC